MAEPDFLRRVESDADIARMVDLGERIWTEHYTPFLAEGQVPYMLAHFHSATTIAEELAHKGYTYFLIRHGNREVGYFGFLDEGETFYLSKFYLGAEARGLGLGRRAIEYLGEEARARGRRAIRLGVNKRNPSIAIYERLGFRITGEMVVDIGGGYVMDDYEMEWTL
jgi:GNAT superfamily N-acetyltransferase